MATFTYSFPDTPGDVVTLTTEDQPSNINLPDDGTYTGYKVTGISGTFQGKQITGLLPGASGTREQDNFGPPTFGENAGFYDNTVFTGDDQGDSPNPDPTGAHPTAGGSHFGVDDYGIGFQTADNSHYSLNYGVVAPNTFGVETNGVLTPINVASNDAPCYATGTLIRILRADAAADVAVEQLHVGDLAVTASGQHHPIRWIGSRSTDCRRHPSPAAVMPVRIRAGALGDDMPARDLVVSPGHGIALDLLGQVLIPAIALLNGSTIVQEDVDSLTYWHVELDSHDLLIAEGQPAESFLDMGNRTFFAHSTGPAAAVDLAGAPDIGPTDRTHANFCRPFHGNGPVADAAREQLKRRALTLGWHLSDTNPWAGVHLMADGRRIAPEVRGLAARFQAPAGAEDLWLMSPVAIPRDLGLNGDPRSLGIFLRELRVDDGWDAGPFALEDGRLDVGFHALEGEPGNFRRWTAGRARLPASLWAGRARTLVIHLDPECPALPRWIGPEKGRMTDPATQHIVAA